VDHEIKEFKGGYEEWVEWKKRMESSVESRESGARRQESDSLKKPEIPDKTISTSGAIDKQLKKELQKQQRIFQQLEEKISKLNDEKQKLEAALADPSTYANKEKFLQIEASYKNISAELEQFNKQYEQVFEKIAELESNN
jgi:ATP-binding cassette subfamily F protein 3